ncbi:4106_t:CDS:2 [Cetraspora pellucida]|uniref:4106_t:CDS:1 n=1 Tax=Cetraspora pellucida TaxID=1433469 RepID=A0A9N9BN82_9GLOM|nr:4106_t:CDS:2 [Cetraspora pellucida]
MLGIKEIIAVENLDLRLLINIRTLVVSRFLFLLGQLGKSFILNSRGSELGNEIRMKTLSFIMKITSSVNKESYCFSKRNNYKNLSVI